MITITEICPPLKMSGRSALNIKFDFNIEVVNILKGLGTFWYNKLDQSWEIPLTSLFSFLDAATFLDDIQLITLPDDKNSTEAEFGSVGYVLSDEEIAMFKVKPFKHQIEGINYGLQHKKWLLLDNQGCGKTNQIIWLAEALKRRGVIEHCLIICGINSLKSNWAKEIKTFSTESSIIIGEKKKKDGTISKTPASISERVEQLKQPIDEFFIIMNVESLRDDKIIKALQTGPNKIKMIAIDECHRCLATGKASTQGSNILKLKAEYEIAASGTPIINTPMNCWGPLTWTDNDRSTLTMFKSQYCKFATTAFTNYQIVGFQNLELLSDELNSCSLRRAKEQLVDLPPKTITVELLDMNEDHRKFYDDIKNGVKEEADKINLNASNLLALTTRLRQASASPSILTTQNISSTKIDRCVELVDELIEQKEKVVVFSTFKEPVYQLEKLLTKYKPLICTGDQADSIVSDNIDMFQKDDEHYLIIGTLAKMSTGLTLNRASYLIMLDEHWTSAMNGQAHDRIYRINNTTPAFIKILVNKNTIDERVHDIAQYKQELSDFVVDGKPTESFTNMLRDIIHGL